MERIPRSHTKEFSRRLYTRAALKDIYALLARSSEEVNCEIGQYRIEKIDEIDTVDLTSVQRISFHVVAGGFFAGMVVTIEPPETTISVADDHDATGMGLAAQIGEVISRLCRSRRGLIQIGSWTTAVILSMGISQAVTHVLAPDAATGLALSTVVAILTIIPLLWLLRKVEPHYIGFAEVQHRSTFWSRKKDDILFWVISGIIGGAVTNVDRLWELAKAILRR